MGLPRSRYVKEGQKGIYHCFCGCVRRAFLVGANAVTNQDFSHRKEWIVERLKFLAGIFAVDVCAFTD
jgi:putative transposase